MLLFLTTTLGNDLISNTSFFFFYQHVHLMVRQKKTNNSFYLFVHSSGTLAGQRKLSGRRDFIQSEAINM